ncbi:MAG: hypothetical protein RL701_7971, partial [Pseudomonadota bacterium]
MRARPRLCDDAQDGGPRIGPKIAAVFALLALIGGAGVAYFERVYARLAGALDRDVVAAREYRWERPVLRGAMGDGNAAEDIYAALAEWKPLGPTLRRELAQRVYYGQALEAQEASALSARGTALRALRTTVQQRWSRTDLVIERGANMLVPDYGDFLEAEVALLADAQGRPPEECLQQAIDVIRIGQDLVPFGPLEASSVATRVINLATRVIARCALHAELLVLRKATHELRVLAEHPAPIGTSLELEELAATSELRQRAALAGKSPVQVIETVFERPQLLAAWSRAGSPARYRHITAERYPDAMEEWRREQDYRSRQSVQAAQAAADVVHGIQDDMRGQAMLRMACVAVSALAERA